MVGGDGNEMMRGERFTPFFLGLFCGGMEMCCHCDIGIKLVLWLVITPDILEIDSRRQELTLPPSMPFWFTIPAIPFPFRCHRQPSTLQMKPLPRTFLGISHDLQIGTNFIFTSNHFSVTYIPTITIRWLVFCDWHSVLHLLLLLFLELFRP